MTPRVDSGETARQEQSYQDLPFEQVSVLVRKAERVKEDIIYFISRLAPVVSAFFLLPVAVFASLIPFHCFTTETIFSTKGNNLSNHYELY